MPMFDNNDAVDAYKSGRIARSYEALQSNNPHPVAKNAPGKPDTPWAAWDLGWRDEDAMMGSAPAERQQ